MRVAHVITGLGTGGAERMLVKLVGRLDRSLVESSVVSLTGPGPLAADLRELGVSAYLPRGRGSMAMAVAHLVRRLRAPDPPDVVQGWMVHGNLAASLAAVARPATALAWNVRQSIYDLRYESRATAMLIRAAARVSSRPGAIVFNSAVSAEQHAALGFATARATVLPNGFDTAVFAPDDAARAEQRRSWGVGDDDFVVGIVARYHPMKDHATLLRAVRRVADGGAAPRIVLVAAGAGMSMDNAALARVVDDLGLRDRVRLLGDRRDVERLYPAFDVAALSSYTEAFPNVVGEAMACAVPCVATDVGAARELVGDAGLVVPARDPAALADALDALRAMSPAARRALGVRARARIVRDFDLDAVTAAYSRLYLDLAPHVVQR